MNKSSPNEPSPGEVWQMKREGAPVWREGSNAYVWQERAHDYLVVVLECEPKVNADYDRTRAVSYLYEDGSLGKMYVPSFVYYYEKTEL